MKKITCPINPKTKEKYECKDCPIRDNCIRDVYDDAEEECAKIWGKADRIVAKIMKGIRGI